MRYKPNHGGIGAVLVALAALVVTPGAFAEEGSKLIATGGALPLAGGAGGGIVPWALLSGYSSREQHGPTGAYTRVESDDYELDALAFSYNLFNRVELSAARQSFDIGALTGALGFDPGELEQDVLGVKVRLTGDAVFTRRPQIAAGFLRSRNREFGIPAAVGARDDESFDYYVAATKVFLTGAFDRTVLLNVTVRSTEANQIGLLGFGGDRGGRHTLGELSAAVFVNRSLAVGFEYRQKPNNLGFAREDDWRDLFVAYFPSKRFAMVAAYADLGSIAGLAEQDGFYVSFLGSR